jgi:hypothetical protein
MSPWREAKTSGRSGFASGWQRQATCRAMRPSRSSRRRCIAGISVSAGTSSPCGSFGSFAHARQSNSDSRPGAKADQARTLNCLFTIAVIPCCSR